MIMMMINKSSNIVVIEIIVRLPRTMMERGEIGTNTAVGGIVMGIEAVAMTMRGDEGMTMTTTTTTMMMMMVVVVVGWREISGRLRPRRPTAVSGLGQWTMSVSASCCFDCPLSWPDPSMNTPSLLVSGAKLLTLAAEGLDHDQYIDC
ncbi:unnamed protein product [Linum tenue]|uniref:Uncharacterized protein n=1 Tax=Linum tenue TaxID=586396 RepID=A0AAV0IDV0_9ROSI|nr:unnamed protein product [Linum tenue]